MLFRFPRAWPSTAAFLALVAAVSAALVFGESPAVAARAPDLVVTTVSKPPAAIGTRQALHVRVQVANRGGKAGRSQVAFFLSSNARWSGADLALTGSVRTAALSSRARVAATATLRLPRDVASTQRLKLIACADARRAIVESNEDNNCRAAAGGVIVVGGSSFDLIDAGVALHRVSSSVAVLYKLYATFGDRRLPKRYRGDGSPVSGTEAVQVAQERLLSLPPSIRAKVKSFLLPPAYRGSFAAVSGGPGRARAAVGGLDPCALLTDEWRNVETGNGLARVWYRKSSRDEAHARALARELGGRIWSSLTAVTVGHVPLPDGGVACGDGGDAKLDVYLYPMGGRYEGETVRFIIGCRKASPSFIVVDSKAPRGVLAHEFMHALHDSYASSGCADFLYLTEATATWAEDRAYHHDQTEHLPGYDGLVVNQSEPLGSGSAYAGWAFIFSATQHAGGDASLVRKLYETEGSSRDPWDVLDHALPHGLLGAWPEFAKDAWNRRLLPSALRASFFNWDAWGVRPNVRPFDYRLQGSEFHERLPIELPGLGKQYDDFRFNNPVAREITFKDPSAVGTDPLLRTWAFVKRARGGWTAEDWTGRQEVQFCRDNTDEDVRDVVLIETTARRPAADNAGRAVTESNKPMLQLRDRCHAKAVLRIGGADRLTVTEDCGVMTQASATWDANVEFKVPPRFGRIVDSMNNIAGTASGNVNDQSDLCFDPQTRSGAVRWSGAGNDDARINIRPTANGAHVTLDNTPLLESANSLGWSPYFVLDASTDPNWCEGPHGDISNEQLRSRHFTVTLEASCNRTVISGGRTYHGVATARGTLEIQRAA